MLIALKHDEKDENNLNYGQIISTKIFNSVCSTPHP
jgi:hypothetical protein